MDDMSFWDMNIRLGDASKRLEQARMDKLLLSLRALEYSGAAVASSCDGGTQCIRGVSPSRDILHNAVSVSHPGITSWTNASMN